MRGAPMKWLSLLCLCTAVACASRGPVADAPKPAFQPQGEFTSTRGYSASFDDERVVGSRVNVTKREDGSWAGTLGGQVITASPTPDGHRLVGPNFEFTWSEVEGGIDGQGILNGERIRVTVNAKDLYLRSADQNWSLWKTGEGVYQDARSTLTLKGRARELPMPQSLFALLSFAEPGI